MTLLSVVVSKGSMDVLELLSEIDVCCFFLHIRHVFELRHSTTFNDIQQHSTTFNDIQRHSAARCFGSVQLKHNFFSLNNFLRSEIVFTIWQSDLWLDFLEYTHSIWYWFAWYISFGFLYGLALLSSDNGLWFRNLEFLQIQFSKTSTNCGNFQSCKSSSFLTRSALIPCNLSKVSLA